MAGKEGIGQARGANMMMAIPNNATGLLYTSDAADERLRARLCVSPSPKKQH